MALDEIVQDDRLKKLPREETARTFFDMLQYYRSWQYYHGGAEHHLHNEPG